MSVFCFSFFGKLIFFFFLLQRQFQITENIGILPFVASSRVKDVLFPGVKVVLLLPPPHKQLPRFSSLTPLFSTAARPFVQKDQVQEGQGIFIKLHFIPHGPPKDQRKNKQCTQKNGYCLIHRTPCYKKIQMAEQNEVFWVPFGQSMQRMYQLGCLRMCLVEKKKQGRNNQNRATNFQNREKTLLFLILLYGYF